MLYSDEIIARVVYMGFETYLLIIAMSVGAGFIGALLGLGGGIVLVPGLTLLFHQDMKIAIAASLVSVIATSSSAATVYVQERFTNIKLGMTLEVATTLGALGGGIAAVYISNRYLALLFAAILIYAGITMLRGRRVNDESAETEVTPSDLDSEYYDHSTGTTVPYSVRNLPLGLFGSFGAGIMSGLLGVGGGIIKVPLMNVAMRIPLKVAVATSNFMIGVTAATGAIVYWMNGKVDPGVTAPAVIGVLIGARLGTKVIGHIKTDVLKKIFVLFIAYTAYEMIMRGLR